jgi:hypothetical protein
MKFRLTNSKGVVIPNAVLRLEYGDLVRNKYTNQYGEAMIDDVLIGDKIKAFVDIRGNKTESEFICQEDNEIHDIILKSINVSIYFWLIPLFAIIGFLIFYTNSDFGNEDENESTTQLDEPKKDSVIITDYSFFVKDKKTNVPVSDAKIKLIYRDTFIERTTDLKGHASFKAFAHILPQKYELMKLGYISNSLDFKLDSNFNIKIAKNDSVEIDPIIVPCGTEVQSKGTKTTIKSFKLNMPKGRFNIWYNLFSMPTKVDVYKGSYEKISQANLIYSNKGFLKGISNPAIYFDSPDSLITVCVEGNAGKTSWVYKVYCARIPVKTVPVTTVPPTE